MAASHFRELDVWKVSMQLTKMVYDMTATFPAQEKFGLATQLRRAAVSVPSNIDEGNARYSRRDYLRFLSIASGSVAEVQTQLLLAEDLELTRRGATKQPLQLVERVSQMLYRMQQTLRRGLDDGSRTPGPGSRNGVSEPGTAESSEDLS